MNYDLVQTALTCGIESFVAGAVTAFALFAHCHALQKIKDNRLAPIAIEDDPELERYVDEGLAAQAEASANNPTKNLAPAIACQTSNAVLRVPMTVASDQTPKQTTGRHPEHNCEYTLDTEPSLEAERARLADLNNAALRKECTTASIVWRNAHGKNKHLKNKEMRDALLTSYHVKSMTNTPDALSA